MKKSTKGIIFTLALAFCLALFAYASENDAVTVTLDEAVIDCKSYGQSALIVDGRTLVPLRAIFESFGAEVRWDAQTKTVFSTLGNDSVKITIGDKNLYKNDVATELDVPAQIISNRTMVPARAVAEAFGARVEWDFENRTVILKYKTGILYENVYYNEWMGLSFDCGENFVCFSGDEIKEAIENSNDITLDNTTNDDAIYDYDLFAVSDSGAMLIIGFEKNEGFSSEYEYLNSEIEDIVEEEILETVDVSSYYKLNVVNTALSAVDVTANIYTSDGTTPIPLYLTCAATEKDGYFFDIVICYFDKEDKNEILSRFSNIDEMPIIENTNESENANSNDDEHESEKSDNLTYNQALAEIEERFAKTEKDENIIAQIGNTKISEAYFDFLSNSAKESYPDSSNEEIAQMCFEHFKSVAFVEQYLTEQKIELSRDYLDIDNIENTFKLYETVYGLSIEEILSELNMTSYLFAKNYVYNIFWSNLAFDEALSSQAIDKALEEFEKENYVRAKHILITFDSEEETEEARVIAEQILAKVKENSKAFDEFVELYGEDPGMESYPGGYYFTTGEMVEPFEKATFALKEGEISDIVETSYGYHIIKRLPMEKKDFLQSSATGSEIYGKCWQDFVSEKANEWYSSLEKDEK